MGGNSDRHLWKRNPKHVHHPKGRNYCLLIAIDEYKDKSICTLANPVTDVLEFKEKLESKYNGCNSWDIRTLYNDKATRKNIDIELKKIKKNIKASYLKKEVPEDNVILYFAGHGYKSDDRASDYLSYFVCWDANPHEDLEYSCPSWQGLMTKHFVEIDQYCFHCLIIVDTCYGGALQKLVSNISMADYKGASVPWSTCDPSSFDLPSRWLITSGRSELVPEGELEEHSPFAKSLLSFLEHAKELEITLYSIMKTFENQRTYQSSALNKRLPPPPQFRKFGEGDQGGQFVFHRPGFADLDLVEANLSSAFYNIDFSLQKGSFRSTWSNNRPHFSMLYLKGMEHDGIEILAKALISIVVKDIGWHFQKWIVEYNINKSELLTLWGIFKHELGLSEEASKKDTISQLLTVLEGSPLVILLTIPEDGILHEQLNQFNEFWYEFRTEISKYLTGKLFPTKEAKEVELTIEEKKSAYEEINKYNNLLLFILNKSSFRAQEKQSVHSDQAELFEDCQKKLRMDPIEKIQPEYKLYDWKEGRMELSSYLPAFSSLAFDDFVEEDFYVRNAIIKICNKLNYPGLPIKLFNLRTPIT